MNTRLILCRMNTMRRAPVTFKLTETHASAKKVVSASGTRSAVACLASSFPIDEQSPLLHDYDLLSSLQLWRRCCRNSALVPSVGAARSPGHGHSGCRWV